MKIELVSQDRHSLNATGQGLLYGNDSVIIFRETTVGADFPTDQPTS